jgi:hypothetical protein
MTTDDCGQIVRLIVSAPVHDASSGVVMSGRLQNKTPWIYRPLLCCVRELFVGITKVMMVMVLSWRTTAPHSTPHIRTTTAVWLPQGKERGACASKVQVKF